MAVSRISTNAIQKIMEGGLKDDQKTTVVIKFYSNNCHYCHALSDYFIDISDEDQFEDIYFFAHNVDDDGVVSEELKLNGVPSIALFQTQGGRCTKTRILKDPDKPNDATWYTTKQIKNFIRREK